MSFLASAPGKITIPMAYLWAALVIIVAAVVILFVVNKMKKGKKAAPVEAAPVAAPVPAPVAVAAAPLAPGSAGAMKLYDTPPKTAAMLMAIVADKMGKPLNELRFISIKEVK